jgi:hypothetical protein
MEWCQQTSIVNHFTNSNIFHHKVVISVGDNQSFCEYFTVLQVFFFLSPVNVHIWSLLHYQVVCKNNDKGTHCSLSFNCILFKEWFSRNYNDLTETTVEVLLLNPLTTQFTRPSLCFFRWTNAKNTWSTVKYSQKLWLSPTENIKAQKTFWWELKCQHTKQGLNNAKCVGIGSTRLKNHIETTQKFHSKITGEEYTMHLLQILQFRMWHMCRPSLCFFRWTNAFHLGRKLLLYCMGWQLCGERYCCL